MSNLFAGINFNFNNAKFEFNFANKTKKENGEIVDLCDLTIKESTILYLYFDEDTNRFISFDKSIIVWKDEVHSLCDRRILKNTNNDYYTLTSQALAIINKRKTKRRLIKPIRDRLYKKPKRKRIA